MSAALDDTDLAPRYTAAVADKVLGVSPKRVHQFAAEERLEVVGRDPLRVP